ncbi:polyprenol phosphomannose-dependent alpha 1,6 mannosyltransferase MptB [Actinoplanes sp. CA-030573]|uniref:polyprenol phosphomannose-dependent alpha 1,6 mannosyltransferase MptB n=1 Tax=Actinoplanes sp. CA-030573 TaxID=3239898 RepID=UPI003D8FAFB3
MRKDHALARAVGFAGSALVAVGGLGAGALPVGVPFTAFGQHARLGLVGVYSGLALLLLAWWWYGRTPRQHRDSDWVTLALWVAPLLLAPPMFSRDVYSYLAQGLMIDQGLDVYRHGPALLGGMVADQVPAIWQNTPSPYGPVFLIVARTVAGPHLLLGIAAMRLVALAGLILLAGAVQVLARGAGINPSAATWLAVLNPLVLIHLIGGAHNDALMVGLLAAGLAAAVRRHPIVATLLVVAAALVKVPAALGLVAVATIWATQPAGENGRWSWARAGGAEAATAAGGRWSWARAAAGVTAIAVGATVVITAVAGTGYGWIGALSTPISPQNWSVTGLFGRWTAGLLGTAAAADVWRWAGTLAVVIVAAVAWAYRHRIGPVYALGIVLVALVVFGPAIRPWYVVWGLVPLAAVAGHPRVRAVLAGFCAVLVLVVLPDGFAADAERVLLAVLGVLIGIAAFLLVRLAVAAPVTLRVAR